MKWTRAIGLSVALVWASIPVAAQAQTLLETVLYIVSGQEARDLAELKNTVTQDEKSIRGELYLRNYPGPPGPLRSTVVVRVAGCKFEVNDKRGFGDPGTMHAIFSVDFSSSAFEDAYATQLSTFGDIIYHPAVIIPGTKYCLSAGRRRDNDIGSGACADTFVVEPRGGDAKMLAAIRHLRKFCLPRVS
jgi:hypothetical protein